MLYQGDLILLEGLPKGLMSVLSPSKLARFQGEMEGTE